MQTVFLPPRRLGLSLQSTLMVVLIGSSLLFLGLANRTENARLFLLAVLGFLGFALPIPLIAYRFYALLRATYQVRPEGIHLRWGLRNEEIPMELILWVSPEHDLEHALPRPVPSWPGGVIGSRRIGQRGTVEYMASQTRPLIVIATESKLFAVSPRQPSEFLQAFQYFAELGNLNPAAPRSVYPASLLGNVWAAAWARILIIGGLAFSLGQLAWITAIIPEDLGSTFQIPFGEQNTRQITSAQILLIPIVNAVFYLVDLLLGLFFFRREESRVLAYLVWGASILTSFLFLYAIYAILFR